MQVAEHKAAVEEAAAAQEAGHKGDPEEAPYEVRPVKLQL
jgi:hypothetical protein